MYQIYTDGAASNNVKGAGIGGYAYIITKNNRIISQKSFSKKNTTNNECELLAIIAACKAVFYTNEEIQIYSDSAYCINCYKQKWWEKWIQNGWLTSKKDPVANKELWEQLIPYFQNPRFRFEKVEGHSSNQFNEMADRMAVAAKFDFIENF